MDQWPQPYSESGSSKRFNSNPPIAQTQILRNYEGNHQVQSPAGFSYEPFKTQQLSTTSPTAIHYQSKDGNKEVIMHDANESYNGMKYSIRPHEQQEFSTGRVSSHHTSYELSAAAQRYSPMETLPSNSLYTSPQQTLNHSGPHQSPTQIRNFPSPSSYTCRSQIRQSQPVNPLPPRDEMYNVSASSSLNSMPVRDPKSPHGSISQTVQGLPDRNPVPKFVKIRALTDLKPKVNAQPAFRRANPEGGFISPLQALTSHLPSTYRICNPSFKYESSQNPRRVLTKPSKGVKNDGYDNEDSDYILYVNDILGSAETGHKNRYLILDVLGQGTFGQVVKCQNLKTQEVVAVKVVKNRTAYFNQSMMEVSVLDLLNTKLDKYDSHHLLRLKDTFIHRQHLCLVFELLSVNLYELIKQNGFRGLSTTLVRVFAQQLLHGLCLLNKARLIHCDLKPENILLKNLESPVIKIIDFGSACDERQTVYTYIQSRFYRSPEVILGLPYSSAIDMWSLGCIVVELFLGLPLFPGSSEYNQVSRIVEMLGNPPNWMLEMGKQAGEFFEKRISPDDYGKRTYHLKSLEQYSREHGTKEQPSKKYFEATTLPDIIKSYVMPRKNMKQHEIEKEMNNRIALIDFVRGLLNINPLERWSPQQAKLHPFITQGKFTGPFIPPMNLKSNTLHRLPAPGTQQQQQAEALSKQRAQVAQAQAHAQAQQSSPQALFMSGATHSQHLHSSQSLQPPLYSTNLFPSNINHQAVTSLYSAQKPGFNQKGIQPQAQSQIAPKNYNSGPPQLQQSLFAQSTTRPNRRRASTMEFQQGGIPVAIQKVASHLDPSQPIRLQPSPAYYPPHLESTVDGNPGTSRRGSTRHSQTAHTGQRSNRDFIRNLEDRTLEEGFMGQSQWH
ncbi:Dual specificity protein kinase [Erysiphe necator]|nr:Dual specificity protein kinase [Erysiphe necator]